MLSNAVTVGRRVAPATNRSSADREETWLQQRSLSFSPPSTAGRFGDFGRGDRNAAAISGMCQLRRNVRDLPVSWQRIGRRNLRAGRPPTTTSRKFTASGPSISIRARRRARYARGRLGYFGGPREVFCSRTELEPIATILLPNSVALPGMAQNSVGRLSQIL
jgi:hypothetical protein